MSDLAISRTSAHPTGWYVMQCQTCTGSLKASKTMVPGRTVHVCEQCKSAKLEDDDMVFTSMDIIYKLQQRACQLDHERRMRELIESEWEDPRWERIQ